MMTALFAQYFYSFFYFIFKKDKAILGCAK